MENSNSKFISPIAIDLGSKNTGIFYLHYKSGECKTLEDLQTIPAFRKTLILETGTGSSYQLLMVDRTQRRHQRRGYTRRKLAKRLARLIIEEELKIPMKPHLKALGFLLNRRGFSYTTFEIDESILRNFPSKLLDEYRDDQYAYEKLSLVPEILGSEEAGNSVDVLEKIHELLEQDDLEKLKALTKEVSSTKRRIGYISSQLRSIKKIPGFEADLKNEVDGLNREYSVNRLQRQLSDAREAEQHEDSLKNEKKQLEKSVLYFKTEYEDLPDITDTELLDFKRYFTWALFKTLDEAEKNLQTGHKPRKQFSKDIFDDLSNVEVVQGQPISKDLYNLREAVEHCSNLGLEQNIRLKRFCYLLANISNLQIKPLRQYFNSKGHIDKDKWQPDRMHSIYAKWLRSWRPRRSDQVELRKELLLDLNNSKLISHWLGTDPKSTIPPYENNNNRRPPECNSLVLTPSKLSVHLPEWREITDKLIQELKSTDSKFIQNWINDQELRETALKRCKSLITYSKILKKSSTKNSNALKDLENQDDIWKCRTLAFILDRSNAHSRANGGKGFAMRLTFGPVNLHSGEQKIRAEETESKLQDLLGDSFGRFEKFANQYFHEVSLAKEGRLFLETGDTLLAICNEKPQQKRHQSVIDIAGVFGISVKKFKKCIEDKIDEVDRDESVQRWLKSFGSLRATSEKASKVQKQYGNHLNEAIQSARKKVESESSPDKDEKQLYSIVSKVEELAQKIGNELDADSNKFNSIFSFAQIYNIGFLERSGFSSTCKLCSYDNIRRMQPYEGVSQKSLHIALAPRISGISVRVIDGVVRKLLEHKAHTIAKLKWKCLKYVRRHNPGAEVSVPILIEQNSFDFEENLNAIKKKKKKAKSIKLEERLNKKKDRIKLYSGGVCPYSGETLEDSGELDHILSRSFTKDVHQTVFNSELNLLYVSSLANRTKNDGELRLSDLHDSYLMKLFKTVDSELIKKEIEEFVEGYDERQFSNFLNLDDETRRNIRHALFLNPENSARKKAERILNSSQRSRVNGTQRYFASLIANHIVRLNERNNAGVPLRLSFDYLEIDSLEVYSLRSSYAEVKQELRKDTSQSPESHSVDAALVFLLALKSNKVRGMLGVEPPEVEYIGDRRDGGNRNFLEASYNSVFAPFYESTRFSELNISRGPTTSNYYSHRPMFRDNFYAGRYLPIVITRKGSIGCGFSESNMVLAVNSSQMKDQTYCNDLLNRLIQFSPNGKIALQKYGFRACESSYSIAKIVEKLNGHGHSSIVLPICHSLVNEYLLDKFNTQTNNSDDKDLRKCLMDKCAYRTEKVVFNRDMADSLLNLLQKSGNWKEYSAKEFCTVLSKNKFTFSIQPLSSKKVNLFVGGKVMHPIWQEWKNFLINWEQQLNCENGDTFDSFCKNYFLAKRGNSRKHQRVRNKFGLPMITSEGRFLQGRKSWTGESQATLQIANDGDPRKGSNIYQVPVITDKGNVEFGGLTKIYRSKSLHRIEHQQGFKGDLVERPTWYRLNLDAILSQEKRQDYSNKGIDSIHFLVADISRPTIRVTLNKYPEAELFSLALLKPRENSESSKNKILEQVKRSPTNPNLWTLTYKGGGYPSGALKSATKS